MNSLDIIVNKLKEQKLNEKEAKTILTDLKKLQVDTDVAIIGMAGQFPDANDIGTLWKQMMEGHSSVRRLPDSYLDCKYPGCYSWGGILEERDCFDPLFFNIAPREAESMNPHQKLVLLESYKALEDSGYNPRLLKNTRVGLFIGAEPTGYLDESFTGYSDALIASRLSYHLDLKGPAMVVNTGCSSSAAALQLAYESILSKTSTIAIAGGVSALLDQKILGRLYDTGMLSLTGEVRTFDEAADGTVISEGIGIVVLKMLTEAERDGDHIYGIIKGIGIGQDGTSNGITAPNGNAQEQLIIDTYRKYQIQPSEISYIETHGTGTKLGDPVEVNALIRAFGSFTDKKRYCALGSIKSYIGHTSAASGVVGLIKILLSMKYHKIPGQMNLKKVNPLVETEDSPFVIHQETVEWKAEDGGTLVAALNSFGHSGTNVHMIIKEYPDQEADEDEKEEKIFFPYSAGSEKQLRSLLGKNLAILEEGKESCLEIVSWLRKIICNILQLQENEISNQDISDDFGWDFVQREQLLLEIERRYRLRFTELELEEMGSIQIMAERIAASEGIAKNSKISLRPMGYTLQVGREALGARVIFLSSDTKQLANQMRAFLDNQKCAGVWSGFHRKRKKETDIETNIIKQWHLNAEYDMIAEAWIHGEFNDWNIFYGNGHPKRMSLPSCEFAKEHYWKKEERRSGKMEDKEFCLTLTGMESYVRDHVLVGEAVVPGAAYIMMVWKAFSQCFEKPLTSCQMKNIGFLSPVIYRRKNIPVTVHLKGNEKDEWDYTIETPDRNGQREIHCNGILKFGEYNEHQILDLEHVGQTCSGRKFSGSEFYQLYEKLDIHYGISHQGVQEVLMGDGILMARLHLSEIVKDADEKYPVHPGLLDSVFQTTFLFDYAKLRDDEAVTAIEKRLPFAIDELIQYKEWPDKLFAIVKEVRTGHGLHDILKFDIDICDENGDLVMHITGFTMKITAHMENELVMFCPNWEETANDVGSVIEYEDKYVIYIYSKTTERPKFQNDWKLSLLEYDINKTIGDNFSKLSEEVFLKIKEILLLKYRKKVLLQIIFPGGQDIICMEGLAGLIRTMRLENPNIIGQLIEVQSSDRNETISRIAEKTMDFSSYECLRYFDNQLQHLFWNETEMTQEEIPFKSHGVYLLTGGIGEIAQIFIKEMIRRADNLTLILAGRTPLNPSIQSKIEEIHGNQVTIVYEQADISDYTTCVSLIERIKSQYQVLNGILHMAGITRDNFIIKKDAVEFKEVIAPKVKGTYNLDVATKDLDLDFMVYFASGSGAVGNIGQSDYAAGNAFMDAYARHRNQLAAQHLRSGRTYAIDWPLWGNGGMRVDAETEQRLEDELGMRVMGDESGIEAFYRIIHSRQHQVYTIYGNKGKIMDHLFTKEEHQAKQLPTDVGSGDLEIRARNYMKELLSDTIKLPAERIDVWEPLETYGIDSILILRMTKQLEKVFGPVPKTLFFEYQNIADLTEYFVDHYQETLSALLYLPSEVEEDSQESEEEKEESFGREDKKIAIIGLAGKYPGGDNCEMFWDMLREGRDCISEIPKERWDYEEYYDEDRDKQGRTYAKWGGFINGVEQFDPQFFNITPYEAELLDPQERLFLECVYHTIEDAGYTRQQLSQKGNNNEYRNVGVYVGVMYEEYQLYGAEETVKGTPVSLGGSQASIANRISYYCDFHGPSMAVDTMCSSSITAVYLACQGILNGACETAVAGGVNITIHPNKYLMLAQGRFASSKGRCESFGEGGDGYVPGEGVGAILLKPLEKAITDGDHIYGVIRSASVNHGGKTNGYSVPNPNAQADVIHKALEQAGINPRTIGYVEAHGTGTRLGDPIEILGLNKAFENYTKDKEFCAIGSVKSNIGHCEGAAGMAAITKVLLQLKHQTLVPSIHSEKLNEDINFSDSPFYVQRELKAWDPPMITEGNAWSVGKRCAGISSFGAGGSNAHMIIEEYCEPKREIHKKTQETAIVLSAKTEKSLKKNAKNLLEYLVRNQGLDLLLEDVGYTLQIGRENMKYRISFVCRSMEEMIEKLTAYVNGIHNDAIYQGISEGSPEKKGIYEAVSNLNQAVQAYVCGGVIDWTHVINCKNFKRVSLPGYYFDEGTYWYKKSTNSFVHRIYPLIECNESDFASQHFTVFLSGSETYIKDHVVQGRTLFPAAAYIEMAREAAEISFSLKDKKKQVVEIKKISFNQPLYIKGHGIKLEIELYINTAEDVIFEIYEMVGQDSEKIYCQGEIAVKSYKENPEISINELLLQCEDSKLDKIQCYDRYDRLGISYGKSMQGVEQIYCGSQWLLAKVSVMTAGEKFILNPAIIDSGFQALIGFEENQKDLLLPYAIDKIEIWKKIDSLLWVYIEKHEKNASMVSFDLTFCNVSGEVCMKIHQFFSRKKKNAEIPHRKRDDSEIYENYMKSIVSSVTKLPAPQIDVLESFDDLGVDSVMVMKMTRQLENVFGMLPKTLFFEYQNIRQLTDYFRDSYQTKLEEAAGNHRCRESLPDLMIEGEELDEISKEMITEHKIRRSERLVHRDENNSVTGDKEDIAVIGLSGSYPMADNLAEFWANLKDGKDCITTIPEGRWDYKPIFDEEKEKEKHIYTKWGGFINHMDEFDPFLFKISPREAEQMDPQERLFLKCAYETVEDAGYSNWLMDQGDEGKNIGVYVGVMYEEYQMYGAEEQVRGNMIALYGNTASIANRVSYYFNFTGPSMAVNTMCSSSLSSIHLACQSILNQECEMALAGGVNLNLHRNKYLLLSEGKFASTKGKCASFGDQGDGYVPGEGVGAILLKPLSKAITDGDHIYGVIKGTGLNHGGRTNGYTVPSPKAQARVIRRAFEQTHVSPDSISYVEAHGTGTELGDPIEIMGLIKVFEPYMQEKQSCPIGSVKSNIGHCEGAAGIAAVTKVLLQMKHKTLVPSLHSNVLNQNIDFASTPFKVQQSLEEWKRPVRNGGMNEEYPLRSCISSFGAGGSNAHIIIEEYKDTVEEEYLVGPYMILLSAKTKEQLKKSAQLLYSYVVDHTISNTEMRNLSYTLQVGRYHMEERMALIAENGKDLEERLLLYMENRKDINYLYENSVTKIKEAVRICNQDEDLEDMIESWMNKGKYNHLLTLWVEGFDIDWRILYRGTNPRRISLPSYPFEEEHYWAPQGEQQYKISNQSETSLENHLADIIDQIINEDSSMEDAVKSISNLI